MISGVQCDVEKLPHAVVRRTLARGTFRDSWGYYSVYSGPSTVGLFSVPKMEHLASKRFVNYEDLKDAVVTWLKTRLPHGMTRVYTNWCHGTINALMSKATIWEGRQRYVPKLVYLISVLL